MNSYGYVNVRWLIQHIFRVQKRCTWWFDYFCFDRLLGLYRLRILVGQNQRQTQSPGYWWYEKTAFRLLLLLVFFFGSKKKYMFAALIIIVLVFWFSQCWCWCLFNSTSVEHRMFSGRCIWYVQLVSVHCFSRKCNH